MKKLPDWLLPAGAVTTVLGVVWLLFRPGAASASTPSSGSKCGDFSGDKKAMQDAINSALAGASPSGVAPANWMWAAKPSYKPDAIGADGKPGAMSCRAAEWLVANKRATAEIAAFANSKTCGCGKPRAPCSTYPMKGPTAPENVRAAIIKAGVARGYPAEQITKALSRESGWRASALNCQGADKHPVAGGLNGMLNSVVQSNGWEGTIDQFAAITADEQLPYILKFMGKVPKPSCEPRPGEFGLALFTPAYVCKPADFVIYEVNSSGWVQNPGLRTAGGGPITVGKVLSTG